MLGGLVLALAGCGDLFVDPFVRDQGSFSVYGTLVSSGAPLEQQLRVQLVRTLSDLPTERNDPAARINVEVTSEDVVTGETIRWDSSGVRLADGSLGVVFASEFRPLPRRTYRIRVRRPVDGQEAVAEVEIPPPPQPTVLAAERDGARVTQPVGWDSRLFEVEVRYYVLRPSGRFDPIPIAYTAPADSVIRLDLVRDRRIARDTLEAVNYDPTLPVRLSRVEITVLGTQEASWPLLPDLDLEAAQPTAYTNVTSGYGLVVGATRGFLSFRPDRDAAIAAGFEPTY